MAQRRFWVFIEQEEGVAHPVSWELLGAVHRLVDECSDEGNDPQDIPIVEGILLGQNVSGVAEEAIRHGAQTVYVVDDPLLKHYLNQSYYQVIVDLAKKYQPEIFLIGATTLGRDLAGAVATSLRTGLTADCTKLEMGEVKGASKRVLLATRPAFGGNVLATIVCKNSLPQMATVRPRVLTAPEPNPEAKGEIIQEKSILTEGSLSTKILEFIHNSQGDDASIEYADVIVAGGRGIGGAEGFRLLQELANELGGVVGASRPCIDAGWMSYPHQVGQTGKTVRPKLYIACGISGALQHKVGMQNSDFVISINKDANAPIFEVSTIGIVGDAFEIIPALIKEIRARKETLA